MCSHAHERANCLNVQTDTVDAEDTLRHTKQRTHMTMVAHSRHTHSRHTQAQAQEKRSTSSTSTTPPIARTNRWWQLRLVRARIAAAASASP